MKITEVRRRLQDCLALHARGALTAVHLQELLDLLAEPGPALQDLLYLQCASTALTSPVLGMQLVTDGRIQPEPESAADFPYATVLAAMRDGWRVVQFPNLALLLDEQRTYGLGCEFILER